MLGMICKTQRAVEGVRESITKFIEGKLFLKVNKEKTVVVYMEVLETPQDPNKEPQEMWNRRYDASRWGSCWMTIRDSHGGAGRELFPIHHFVLKIFNFSHNY